MKPRSLFVLCGLLFCGADIAPAQTVRESPGQVWQVGSRRWDMAAEERFAAWVEENVTENFLLRNGIAVDCADVPYAIRWIYARIAHLPAAATVGDNRLVGHWSTAWAGLPTHQEWQRDARFRAALENVLARTTTSTLPADTFPIRIEPYSVLAGAVFFSTQGHAGMVGSVVFDGSTVHPLQTWEATLPRKLRKMRARNFFATCPEAEAGSGLTRFRWPVFMDGRWSYSPPEESPYYSTEQYGPGFCMGDEYFDVAVARRIDPRQYDPRDKAEKLINSIARRLYERVPIILEGFACCRGGGCPEGSYLWEVHSTPSRDGMISLLVQHLEQLAEVNHLDWQAMKKRMEGRGILIGQGLETTLAYLVENHLWLSPDPGDSFEARWALAICPRIRARMEHTIEAMDFVEQKYRTTDPSYADYGRELHMTNFSWLQEEAKRVGCGDLSPLPAGK